MQVEDIQYFFNAGISYSQEDKHELAIESYKKAIEINPNYSQIYYNLAITYFKINQYDLAIINFKKATELDPNFHLAFNNLGIIYAQKKQYDLAIEYFNKALTVNNSDIGTYLNLANTYFNKNEYDSAAEYYRKVLDLNPNDANAYVKSGIILSKKDETDKAILYYQKALELEPENVEALYSLGDAFKIKKETEKAIYYYEEAVKLKKDSPELYNNLGFAYLEQGDSSKAIFYCKKALELNPDYISAIINLTDVYFKNNTVEDAKYYMDKAYELNIKNPEYALNLSLKYLLTRDFEKGFKLYEQRFFIEKNSYPKIITQKSKWDGNDIKGKTIFVSNEQGLGDSIQFIRFIPTLISLGAKVLFMAQPDLQKLFNQSNLDAEILNYSHKLENYKFDTYTYLLSLPYLLKTNIQNIPCKTKYLKAKDNQVQFYKEKYFSNDCFKIGIYWQGNPNSSVDNGRSIPLKYFDKLKDIPNIKIYSLQKEHGLDQLNSINNDMEIVRIGETFNDFSETAAAIENLDLIIGSDTAIAHLAGALGKPVWMLLHTENEWRWSYDIEYSYWYESMRIFRQKEPENWGEVMERIHESLMDLLKIKELN